MQNSTYLRAGERQVAFKAPPALARALDAAAGREGVTILDALAETTKWFPKAAPAPKAKAEPRQPDPKPASPSPRPAHGAHVPGRNDAMAQLAAGLDRAAEADADALARQIAAGPNPWLAGRHFNRTKQAVLTNRNPDLAARLKAEAGAY